MYVYKRKAPKSPKIAANPRLLIVKRDSAPLVARVGVANGELTVEDTAWIPPIGLVVRVGCMALILTFSLTPSTKPKKPLTKPDQDLQQQGLQHQILVW